jgi:hypothetical protein
MTPRPICKYLRTKKMFIPALQDEALQEMQEGNCDAHYWCNCTMSEVGPDDKAVNPQVCNTKRSCFETDFVA